MVDMVDMVDVKEEDLRFKLGSTRMSWLIN
jgi:hypothetical protein